MGVAGTLLENVERIPKFIIDTISNKPTSGIYELKLMLSLPEGWSEAMNYALERARRKF